MIRGRTPGAISGRVLKFCKRIAPGTPVYLSVEPEAGAQVNDCFGVVDNRVQRDGGEVLIGWQIWEHPGILLEAEFHAVWRDSNGMLHDLTPKPAGITRILFLPDSKRTYQGRQVNNIREAISDAPAVHAFIAAADAEFEFNNRGDRADQHGEIVFTGKDRDEYLEIQRRKLDAELAMLSNVGRPGQSGRNDPCSCGSGKKFKKCHGAA